jgi:hypothetical protein
MIAPPSVMPQLYVWVVAMQRRVEASYGSLKYNGYIVKARGLRYDVGDVLSSRPSLEHTSNSLLNLMGRHISLEHPSRAP